MDRHNLMVILGATASGKTKLAVSVADALNGEIISADSRQIFKRMDIGTGKDLQEYHINGKTIPYHLIDILEPGERYHVDAFKNDFYQAFESITQKNKITILCGGTGMYIHSLLQNQTYTAIPVNEKLREELSFSSKEELIAKLKNTNHQDHSHVDLSSKKRLIRAIEIAEYLKNNQLPFINRPALKPIIFGLKNEVEITRSKILARLDQRFKSGLIEEVAQLLKEGISKEILVFYGLEYKFIVNYLDGLFTFDELKLKLGTAICQYAKRQNTFFRKMEKDSIEIIWLDASAPTNLLQQLVTEKVSLI
ncbi:tRNA (adenosine(37)-N6)-dimethylallyltransferase MiaA [Pedobacter sp. ISL-68]|uniref:tRNA (adenosine(37)-N6)-dimethylallyltransferase MiaA n=1 Tax=unclassified Pedobacter TaxID=2628915 RepID=UPI001BECE9E3|nr:MULTISPECIES: tRNA (adenosine(37)-N6)-dimethylallyltransferase MiaA [unclassified Pedobacter]MBT2562007.1 tRNA (adenosine(37)-N6)-dimethylallyltransferase MiaA [Pedobacter sp. ISL-64]MBT2591594.1 tRNA (adenosine(37)-N6)-dimethylallyltransferase MiaA [Pedobacter sp. ISL-68]